MRRMFWSAMQFGSGAMQMHKFFIIVSAALFLLASNALAQGIDATALIRSGAIDGLSQADLNALEQRQADGAEPQSGAVSNVPETKNGSDFFQITSELELAEQEDISSPIIEYYKVLTGEKLTAFGADMFAFEQDPSVLFFNTISDDYVVSAGDSLAVTTRGIDSSDLRLTVNKNGEINLPNMDPVRVSGLSLDEIQNELGDRLRVDDASARAFVNLDSARLVPVRITGSVQTPKSFAVPAYTPLSRILGYVGKLGPQASLRNITLFYETGEKEEFDLYDVLVSDGDITDPVISSAVRIHFGTLGSTVAVSGFGGRAAIYELAKDQKTIDGQELFKLANISLIPPGADIEVLTFDQNGISSAISVGRDGSFQLSNGQAIRIQFIQTKNISSVEVNGATISDFSVVVSQPVSVASVLKNGAVLSNEAFLEFALVKQSGSGHTQVRAIDLRHALTNPDKVVIDAGEKLTVFSNEIYDRILKYDAMKANSQDDSFVRDLEVERYLSDIRVSGASEIYLDDMRVAFLAPLPEQTVVDLIDSRLNVPVDLSKDYAVLIDPDNRGQSAKAFTIGAARINSRNFTVPRGWRLHLFSEGFLADVELANVVTGLTDFSVGAQAIEASNPAELTIDGRRAALLPAGLHLHRSDIAAQLRNSLELYPLYASVITKQSGTLFYNNTAYRLDALIGTSSDFEVSPGQRIDVFTTAFVRNVFEDVEQTATALEDLSVSPETDAIIDEAADAIVQTASDNRAVVAQEREKVKTALNGLKAASKLVTGAVEQPGFYPVAGNVTMAEMLSVANGVLPNADISRVGLRSYYANSAGALNLRSSKKIDLKSVPAHKIVLTGDFDVQVPSYINNASIGQIFLSGEVQRPGEYTFSRSETLHDVIQRAGGFSSVAYPLGAVFTRDSLKAEQKAANLTLARQVEQSILSLSQSDRTGAGEQIAAVIAFANQLKATPVSGRQTVNVALRNKSNPIYLQDGDEVFIPQRPSHISVIGSVFSQVSTDFNPHKTLADYISDAGGLDRIADQKKIFMVLPNGQSKPIATANDDTVIIPPGAVIVVPPKTDKLTALGLTEIVSKILGNIATSLLAINAVK